MLDRFRQFYCWLTTGHSLIIKSRMVLDFDDDWREVSYMHTYTECMECGHESHGWDYGDSYIGPKIANYREVKR